MADILYKEKANQFKSEIYDKIKIVEYLINNNKGFGEQSSKGRKYSLLKLNKDFSVRIKIIKKQLLGFFLIIISYFYYYLSLEACFKGEAKCSLLYSWQISKIYQELKSCFLMALFLELIFYKFISKLHLVHCILVFLLFYIYSHGMVFEDHGYYNFIYFFIITALLILIISFKIESLFLLIFFFILSKKNHILLY